MVLGSPGAEDISSRTFDVSHVHCFEDAGCGKQVHETQLKTLFVQQQEHPPSNGIVKGDLFGSIRCFRKWWCKVEVYYTI